MHPSMITNVNSKSTLHYVQLWVLYITVSCYYDIIPYYSTIATYYKLGVNLETTKILCEQLNGHKKISVASI